MTDQEQKDLRSYCAYLLKEYGFDIPATDPIMPALYIIYKEMRSAIKSNSELASLVKEGTTKVRPKVYHFDSTDAAFKFQIGIAVKWLLTGSLLPISLGIYTWFWSMSNNVDQAKAIINSSENIRKLVARMQTDSKGYSFVDFTAAKASKIQPIKEYRQLNPNTVRVYLAASEE